jgi:polyhydroxyalkanoate synthesis regulator phasin
VGIGMERLSQKLEAVQLTTDELLKQMSKEQATVLIQHILRRVEESSNEPDAPAVKIRMQRILEELKRS